MCLFSNGLLLVHRYVNVIICKYLYCKFLVHYLLVHYTWNIVYWWMQVPTCTLCQSACMHCENIILNLESVCQNLHWNVQILQKSLKSGNLGWNLEILDNLSGNPEILHEILKSLRKSKISYRIFSVINPSVKTSYYYICEYLHCDS